MKNNSFSQIADTIKNAKSIAFFTHIDPDLDAIGSALSLYFACKNLGKKVAFFSKENFTEIQLMFLENCNVSSSTCDTSQFDLFISTDAPAMYRLGDYAEIFNDKNNTIVIDHHINCGLIGRQNYVNTEMSSCSEISYQILRAMKANITPQIATLLYAGLSSDTFSFINTKTNSNSFWTAYKLVKAGADILKVNELQYRRHTKKEVEFKKYLWTNFQIVDDCAYCTIPLKELQAMNGKKSDFDSYSSELVSLKDIHYSFSLAETSKGFFEASFRAKSGYDVRSVAMKFGGGGHIEAAGAKFNAENIQQATNMILDEIKKQKSEKNGN